MRSVTHRRPQKCIISLPYRAEMRGTRRLRSTKNPGQHIF